jgi:hypothetical protein
MKNAIFWDVMQYGCCKNRRFGGTDRLLNHKDYSVASYCKRWS